MHAHPSSGQWRRVYRGRDYYFGVLGDPKAALARWRAEWPLIASGKDIVVERLDSAVGLAAAVKGFLGEKVGDLDRGYIVADTLDGYRQDCQKLCDLIGNDTPLRLINDDHFGLIMDSMKGYAPSTIADRVVKYRTILNWIADRYKVPLRPPKSFRGPPMKMRRMADTRARLWTPKEIHAILGVASPLIRACVLMGINGGYKPTDLAFTRTDELDLRGKIITQQRHKTGSDRCVPLWPETIKALEPLIDPSRAWLLVWPNGLQLVRHGCRDLSRALKPLRDGLGIKAEYQWLRHTFATVADRAGDDGAKDLIMGHVRDSVPDNYVLQFDIKRLRRVSDHVRRWLFG